MGTKRGGVAVLLVGLFFLALAGGGCGGGSGDGNDKKSGVDIDGLTSEMNKNPQFEGYVVLTEDEIPNPEEIAEAAYVIIGKNGLNGVAENGPVAAALKNVLDLSDGEGDCIVLMEPTRAEIEKLQRILGESFGIVPEKDDDFIFYGIGSTKEGHVRVCGHLAPVTEGTITHDSGDGEEVSTTYNPGEEDLDITDEYYATFTDWLKNDEIKEADLPSLGAGADGDSITQNILDMAKQYVGTVEGKMHRDNCYTKRFTIGNYVTAVHDFDNDKDYFWVHQRCILDGSDGFVAKKYQNGHYTSKVDGNKYWVGGAEIVDVFMSKYQIRNTPNVSADLHLAEPQATNRETTYTSTKTYGVNASVGIQGGKQNGNPQLLVSGNLGFNAGFSDTVSFSKQDVEASLHPDLSNGGTGWNYDFNISTERGSKLWTLKYDPPTLSHSAFNPETIWLWSAPTGRLGSFTTSLNATVEGIYSRNSGSLTPRTISSAADAITSAAVALPQPPLLAADVSNLVFPIQVGQNVGDDKNRYDLNVRGQGGWSAAITSGSDWFTILKTGDILSVKMTSDNTTGQAREGTIRVTRSGAAADTIDISVNQLPN